MWASKVSTIILAIVIRLSETIEEAEGKVEEAYSMRKEEGERRSERSSKRLDRILSDESCILHIALFRH